MAKATNTFSEKDEAGTGFPIPFSIEAFREDIAAVFLHHVRCIAWMTDAETAWAITKAPPLEYPNFLFRDDASPEELGLTYECIRETNFAVYLERLYDYAFLGQLDTNKEPLEDESIHTWLSALIYDAANGEMTEECALNGIFTCQSAERCLLVAETANARVTLEGGAPFFSRFQGGKDGFLEEDFLSIRQMALLAGMEEMSVRAAANPKRANPLNTVTTDNGTRIAIGVAKEWLRLKGRYVPIKYEWTKGDINLAKQRFSSVGELDSALYARYQMMSSQEPATDIGDSIKNLGVDSVFEISAPFIKHNGDPIKAKQLEAIAELLKLPGKLLFLRAKEADALDLLRGIENAVREYAQSQ